MYVRAGSDVGGVQRSVRYPAEATTSCSRSVVSATTDGCSEAAPCPVSRIESETTGAARELEVEAGGGARDRVLTVANSGPSPA